MAKKTQMGTISFIHHDKQYATIDYELNEKKKTINGPIDEKTQLKFSKKIHTFHIGDTVSFEIALSPRGDKMIATQIKYRYNNPLDNMINKAAVENRFVGYLKKVDTKYFVKETSSYVLLPLLLSPWEKLPSEDKLNEPIFFKLNKFNTPDKATASMYKSVYIAAYMAATKAFNNKTILDVVVNKITPHGIFVEIISPQIQAKIATKNNASSNLKIGDTIKIIISYLGHNRIVVEQV